MNPGGHLYHRAQTRAQLSDQRNNYFFCGFTENNLFFSIYLCSPLILDDCFGLKNKLNIVHLEFYQ